MIFWTIIIDIKFPHLFILLASYLNVSLATIEDTFANYISSSVQYLKDQVPDEFGKKDFAHAKGFTKDGPYYVGFVTPALHYTMGGLAINTNGQALRKDGSVYTGLYVAGEATGGIHGVNRLGGNALSECVVFGRLVGSFIPFDTDTVTESERKEERMEITEEQTEKNEMPVISVKELKTHTTEESLWTAIDGKVYDLTAFLEEHP